MICLYLLSAGEYSPDALAAAASAASCCMYFSLTHSKIFSGLISV